MRVLLHTALLAAAAALLPLPVLAQAYPSKPIRVVISFPPGSSVDFLARALGQKVSENIGQQVVVDNRVGGNTIISADVAAHAPADGYTLLQALDQTFTLIPSAYAKVPYDPQKDFAPITQLTVASTAYFAPAKAPYRSLPELIAHAKSNPGKLNVGTANPLSQIFIVALKSAGSVDFTYVPYKGTPQMLQALLAGEIDIALDSIPIYLPQIKAGKVLALATSAPARTAQLPDTPTVREAGYPQLEAEAWTGLFAPVRTPTAIIARLNAEWVKVLNDAGFRQKMIEAGQNPLTPSTPEQLGALVKEGIEKWGPMVKAAGIKLD